MSGRTLRLTHKTTDATRVLSGWHQDPEYEVDLSADVLASAIDTIDLNPPPTSFALDGALRTGDLLLEQHRAQ